MRSFFRPGTLLCFSPPVMLATIIIELGIAGWVLARYATNTNRRILVTILICLAGFQIAELNVCATTEPDLIWSRVGYIFITLLPPLGLHLITRQARLGRWLVWPAYVTAAAFVALFTFAPASLNTGVCAGNYVIFNLAEPFNALYSYYYMMVLFVGMIIALIRARSGSQARRFSLLWIAGGYLAFIVPSYVIYFLAPSTGQVLPSIMCGFALTLAVILGVKVAPQLKN